MHNINVMLVFITYEILKDLTSSDFGLQIVLVCTVHHLIIIIVQIHLRALPVRYILSSV